MRYILIPVKDLSHAKQRLSALMTQVERTRLAWAMLNLTLGAATAVRGIDRVAMVTSYQPAIELAQSYGIEVIRETEQVSESASVDFGSRLLEQKGGEAVLRLPIDLPLLTPADIERILEYDAPGPSTTIVPSRDGTGTNAILRRPPTLFPSYFGRGSREKHVHEARLHKARCQVIELERISLDIDEPEDVKEFLKRDQTSPLHDLLIEIGLEGKLRSLLG